MYCCEKSLSALRVEIHCNCNCVDKLICVVYTGGGCFSCHFERDCVLLYSDDVHNVTLASLMRCERYFSLADLK